MDLGALATASAVAAQVAHSRRAGRQALLPGAGQHRAEEVLAGERDEQRPAELAQLAQAPQDLEAVGDAEVEVEPGVERELLLGDACAERAASIRSANQPFRWSTGSS